MRYIFIVFAYLIFCSCSKNEGCFSYSENGEVVFIDCGGDNYHSTLNDGTPYTRLDNGIEIIFIGASNPTYFYIYERGRISNEYFETIEDDIGYFEGVRSWKNEDGDIFEIRYWDIPEK